MDNLGTLIGDCEAMVKRDLPDGWSLVSSAGWYWACPHTTDGRQFGPFVDPFEALDAVAAHLQRMEG